MQTRRFLDHIRLISRPDAEESDAEDFALNAFAYSVLEVTDFHWQIGTLLLPLHSLPLTICGIAIKRRFQIYVL